MIKELYKLPQYQAIETGVPCVALDDVEKLIKDTFKQIKLATESGMIFTGEFNEDGLPDFMGTTQQWSEYEARLEENNLI